MSVMRYTIVHDNGGVSFVADEFMLPALVAACASNPRTYQDFLDAAHEFDRRTRDYVRNGLAVFDEHNVPENYGAVHREIEDQQQNYMSTFRIVDERTRQASLQPVKAGLVIFNLKDRRIVQVQNSAGIAAIERTGTAQHHNGQRWTARVHRYTLPDGWTIVP